LVRLSEADRAHGGLSSFDGLRGRRQGSSDVGREGLRMASGLATGPHAEEHRSAHTLDAASPSLQAAMRLEAWGPPHPSRRPPSQALRRALRMRADWDRAFAWYSVVKQPSGIGPCLGS